MYPVTDSVGEVAGFPSPVGCDGTLLGFFILKLGNIYAKRFYFFIYNNFK
jgi:hypothetical protein